MKDKGDLIELASKISVLAKLKDIKQTNIALKCDLSKITVCRFMRGKTDIKASDFLKLLSMFGIDVHKQVEEILIEEVLKSRQSQPQTEEQPSQPAEEIVHNNLRAIM